MHRLLQVGARFEVGLVMPAQRHSFARFEVDLVMLAQWHSFPIVC